MTHPIHKQINFAQLRHLDAQGECKTCDAVRTVSFVMGAVIIMFFLFYLLMAVPAHADECSGDTGSSNAPPGATESSPK